MTGWRKSSYSAANGCLQVKFERSSHCADSTCVEVAHDGPAVLVRNSRDPNGPRLVFTEDEWTAFLAGVVSGEFDLP